VDHCRRLQRLPDLAQSPGEEGEREGTGKHQSFAKPGFEPPHTLCHSWLIGNSGDLR